MTCLTLPLVVLQIQLHVRTVHDDVFDLDLRLTFDLPWKISHQLHTAEKKYVLLC